MKYPDISDPEVQRVIKDTGMGELQAMRHVMQRRALVSGMHAQGLRQFSDVSIYKIAQRIADIEEQEIRGREIVADKEFIDGFWADLMARQEFRRVQAQNVQAEIDLLSSAHDPAYKDSDDPQTWHAGQAKENKRQGLLMRLRRLVGGK